MILERDQWHLGYASLLRDCRGTDHGGGGLTTSTSTATNNTGRTLLLVHPDVDAMCSARILGYMLRADGVPHQLRVCTGWGRLCKILTGMGVIISPPLTEDENGGGGGGVMDKVAQHDDDEDYNINNESTATSSTITCDVRAVVLVNMGANRNLAKLFNSFANANSQEGNSSSSSSHKQVRCYVIDSHRPYHLANIHVGKDVVLFNDRPLDEDEIPSDGDDLSGNDDSSSSSSDEDDEEDDNGDGTKRSSTRKNSVWDDVYSDEEEFESDSKAAEDDDEEVVEEENDSDADDESLSMAAAAKRAGLTTKRSRKVGLDYNDDPGDVPLEELQDSDEEDNNDDDEGSRWSKRRRSSQGLNTTTTTANLTTIMDETLEDDDGQQQLASSQTTSSSSTIQKVDYRELRKQRRTRVRLHYSSGSYHASPSSWTAYALCRQLRFGDIPDLLWLACVGLTDAYLHGKLDVAGYSALSINMKQNVGRLFPNDVIDRAGRAVYAEELETTYYQDTNTSNNGGGALTRIGLSENGRILYQDEYKFMLLRHTSLWDSMLHSNFVASKLRVWKSAGRQKLMELLAKIGFPLDQCRQPWAFVGPGMKRRLGERLDDCAEEYGLENVKYTGFVRVTGYKSRLSASDMSYAVTALLECSAAAMDGGLSVSNSSNVDDNNDESLAGLNEEDREDREMIEAFNVAFDALNSNGGGPISSSVESMLTEVGGGEGADLSNLVNGGNMTGTTGLGAGIRLAMTLQRTIMSTARGLVDRNAITRLSHFRYAYLHCTSGGGGGGATLSNSSSSNGRVVTPDPSGNKNGETSTTNNRSNQFHVFAKPLVLTRLAHFLMDMHREDGKWTGTKSRPLVLLAEKPRSNTYMVVGYECPEEAGNVVKNKFGQNFDLAAKSMRGMFWFDSFDSNVVEVAARDVQKFLEQLHYMMEQVT